MLFLKQLKMYKKFLSRNQWNTDHLRLDNNTVCTNRHSYYAPDSGGCFMCPVTDSFQNKRHDSSQNSGKFFIALPNQVLKKVRGLSEDISINFNYCLLVGYFIQLSHDLYFMKNGNVVRGDFVTLGQTTYFLCQCITHQFLHYS